MQSVGLQVMAKDLRSRKALNYIRQSWKDEQDQWGDQTSFLIYHGVTKAMSRHIICDPVTKRPYLRPDDENALPPENRYYWKGTLDETTFYRVLDLTSPAPEKQFYEDEMHYRLVQHAKQAEKAEQELGRKHKKRKKRNRHSMHEVTSFDEPKTSSVVEWISDVSDIYWGDASDDDARHDCAF